MAHYITAYYHFMPLEDLETQAQVLRQQAQRWGLLGLMILAPEGINATISAPSQAIREAWKQFLQERWNCVIEFKDSQSMKPPFRRFKVKVRDEICTTRGQTTMASNQDNHHLTPSQWNQVMKEESDWVMIDTRNDYEYQIGSFRGAVNPQTDRFSDFFDQVESMNLPKDKKLLIFCTGGIRCHKGILELQNRGYEQVYQLRGGILKYLEEYPNDQFEGECFVFDHRVAVDQNLQPSQTYGLCPHCGDPAPQEITCAFCGQTARLCVPCAQKAGNQATCSKDCAHRWQHQQAKRDRAQRAASATPGSASLIRARSRDRKSVRA